MKHIRKTVSLTALIMGILMSAYGVGQAFQQKSDLDSVIQDKKADTSIYAVYSTWVEKNIPSDGMLSFYYLPDTVTEVEMDDGDPAVSFETWQHDHFVRNTLVDAGENLMLYTIADPTFEVTYSTTSYEKFFTQQNKYQAASSCDQKYQCNCVYWVRYCKASWLPTGMTYIWEKKAKINTQSEKSGRVAVMDIYYPYGHVAYITKVSGTKITIEEANYKSCKVSSRTGTKSAMKIAGFIKK
jgi:hypothetical protein